MFDLTCESEVEMVPPRKMAYTPLLDADRELDKFMRKHDEVLVAADFVQGLRRAGGELVEAYRGTGRLSQELLWLCSTVVDACQSHRPFRAHELGLLDSVIDEARARASQGRLQRRLAAQAHARAKMLGNLSHVDTPTSARELASEVSLQPRTGARDTELELPGCFDLEDMATQRTTSSATPTSTDAASFAGTHEARTCADQAWKGDSAHPRTPPCFFANFLRCPEDALPRPEVSAMWSNPTPRVDSTSSKQPIAVPRGGLSNTFQSNILTGDAGDFEWFCDGPQQADCPLRLEDRQLQIADGPTFEIPLADPNSNVVVLASSMDNAYAQTPAVRRNPSSIDFPYVPEMATRRVGALIEMIASCSFSSLRRAGLGLVALVFVFWVARKYSRLKDELRRLSRIAAEERSRVRALQGLLLRRGGRQ